MGILDAPGLLPSTAAKTYGRHLRNVNSRGGVGTARSNGTDTSQTSRLRFPLRGEVGSVRLVFTNFYLPSGGGETTNAFNVTVKASIEDPTAAAGSPTGAITTPVFFGGSRTAVLAAGGVLVSDPILVNLAADSPLWVRSSATVAAAERFPTPYLSVFSGSAVFDGGGVNEGVVVNTDSVDSGTIAGSNSFAFGPVAIVTEASSNTQHGALILGDSLQDSSTGLISQGQASYLSRACINAGIPFVRLADGGERFVTTKLQKNFWRRMQFARYARHAIVNYGINDILQGSSLATLKADAISFWQMMNRCGLVVHQATLLPHPGASTDGYMTVAGQSIASSAFETIRTGFNSWLRSGQANTDSGGILKSVIESCSQVEVNAAGTLTLNGGFWKSAGASVASGTATSYTTGSLTDTGAARTASADKALTVAIVSATTGAGQAAEVLSNTTTAWTFNSTITLPTGTVTYQLGPSYCYDGTHMTEGGHILVGNAIDLSYVKAA